MTTACRWCGDLHGVRCPWVKAIEFAPENGIIITRVEFLTPADLVEIKTAISTPDDYPKIGARNAKD